jgi:peptidoglycan/xylan/chitin deacetylase (PgdA/CDA1 family)
MGLPGRLLRRALAATCPRRLFIASGPGGRDVCLTFDDGPHPQYTPRVLETLEREGVKATFFLIGRHADRYPDLVREIVARGHDIGHHSYEHGDPNATSARALMDEIDRTGTVFRVTLGRSVRLVRPPHGRVTVPKLLSLWRRGYGVVLWSVDPQDFNCRSSEDLRRRLAGVRLRGGDIVLLHDNRPYAPAVLQELIRRIRADKLGFCPVSRWTETASGRAAS